MAMIDFIVLKFNLTTILDNNKLRMAWKMIIKGESNGQ